MLRLFILALIVLRLQAADAVCPETGTELQAVVDGHLREGRLDQAERITRACLEEWSKVLPFTHADRLTATSYLGLVMLLNGQTEEAGALLTSTYQQAEKTGDPMAMAMAAAYLGSYHRHQGNLARALPLLRTAHQTYLMAQGPDAGIVGSMLMEIGALQAGEGKYALAEKAFQEAHRILRKHRFDVELRVCEIYLAACATERGRPREAERRLLSAMSEDGSALDHTTRTLAMYHLARLYRREHRDSEADQYYRRTLAGYAEAAVPPFPHVSEVAAEYAQFLKQQHRPEARSWAAKAKAWRQK